MHTQRQIGLPGLAGHGRVFAIDAARGFAIFAMVVAHTAPYLRPAPKAIGSVEGLLNDVAAPLFALIIGVTIARTAPSQAGASVGIDARAGRRAYRWQTGKKGLILIALGLALTLAPSGVVVVLQYLGVTMLLLIPLLFLRTRALLALAAGLIVIAPGIITVGRELVLVMPALQYPATPFTMLLDWTVLGRSYQAVILLSMALLGIAIGRAALDTSRVLVTVLVVSVVAFLPAQVWATLDLPGTTVRGGYVEVLRETPLAVGTFAFIAWATHAARDRVRRVSRAVFAPIVPQGRMALSIYVFHVVLLMGVVAVQAPQNPWVAAWMTWPRGALIQVGLVVLCAVAAALWGRYLGTGPLERLLGVVAGRRRLATLWSRPAARA